MKSVNKVILLGNLTRDPELRHTENSKAVCTFGLATNRSWTTKTGQKQEEPEFHRIVAWEKLAETCHQYLRKGRKVYVEGRLQSHTYTGQDGVEKTGVEVVLEDLVFVDPMPKDLQETSGSAKA
jgi:single-strand DNA-binding protein